MLRGVGLLNAEALDQSASRQLAFAQMLNNGDARRVGESLKDFSLKLPQCVFHKQNISIYEIKNIKHEKEV